MGFSSFFTNMKSNTVRKELKTVIAKTSESTQELY